jgi:hypothetical protein
MRGRTEPLWAVSLRTGLVILILQQLKYILSPNILIMWVILGYFVLYFSAILLSTIKGE